MNTDRKEAARPLFSFNVRDLHGKSWTEAEPSPGGIPHDVWDILCRQATSNGEAFLYMKKGRPDMAYRTLSEFQKKIGYHFKNRALLHQALSHSSYANEHRLEHFHDNERLEFLGDAVLEVVSSDFLYHEYPDMHEGQMTRLRASLVCEPTLAMCAREFDLSSYILLGRGEEHTGGRTRNSIVSDALEALIGAIYLDGGLEPARTFIERFILTDIEHKKLFYDSKTILQERVQQDHGQDSIRYNIVGEEGPDHAKLFHVEVTIDGVVAGSGSGSTKKAAEQEAAWQALQSMLSASSTPEGT